ncbi:MAG: WD40 repeat domain-containing protein, partial [Nitrosospira sp.]
MPGPGFFHRSKVPEHPWLDKFDDRVTGEGDAGKRIDRFCAEVSKRHGIRTFRNPDELASLVLEAILATLQDVSSRSTDPLLQRSYHWPDAWDFGLYMAEKRGTFVGREWLFRDIAEWLDAGLPRALLIRADFGVGKSALMAELVHRNSGGVIAAWHFCQYDTHETLHPATFVRSLAAQFKASIPGFREAVEADITLQERLDRALTDPASAFEAAILTPLWKLEAPIGGHRLLIIDALDEALELDHEVAFRFGTLVKLVADRAGRFPTWLRILATSRNNPQVIIPLQQAFELKEIDAESAANQDDLRKYVMERCAREPLASQLHGSGYSAEQIAIVLSEKSLGKFLYAIRVLMDLENGTIGAHDLIHLPPGMDSFYLDAFERRFARAGKDYTSVREVLGILAIAREPLPLATIADILDQPEAQVKAVRSVLPDFLRLRDGRLTFDHFSMAEWLTGETEDGFARASTYAVDVTASETRLHRWALSKVSEGKAHTSEYLVRHLASHLVDADERRRIYTHLMLSNPEWLAARLHISGIEVLITDCDHLGETDEVLALLVLLRNSAHVLRRFPDQLPAQLLGRIRWLQDPENQTSLLLGLLHNSAHILRRFPIQLPTQLLERMRSLQDSTNPLAELASSTLHWLERQPTVVTVDRPLVPTTGSLRFSLARRATFTGHAVDPTILAVLPNGHIASGTADGSVRVWNPGARHGPQVFEGHKGRVRALVVVPEGRIASGADDGSVRIWDPQGRHEPQVFNGHTGGIRTLEVLSDGRIASGATDGSVRIWDPQSRYEPQVFKRHTGGVWALTVLPETRVISSAGNDSERVWDLQDCHGLQVFEGRTDGIRALVVLPDGRIASGTANGLVRVWDPKGSHGAQVFKEHTGGIRAL